MSHLLKNMNFNPNATTEEIVEKWTNLGFLDKLDYNDGSWGQHFSHQIENHKLIRLKIALSFEEAAKIIADSDFIHDDTIILPIIRRVLIQVLTSSHDKESFDKMLSSITTEEVFNEIVRIYNPVNKLMELIYSGLDPNLVDSTLLSANFTIKQISNLLFMKYNENNKLKVFFN